jgi:hypothetical protein
MRSRNAMQSTQNKALIPAEDQYPITQKTTLGSINTSFTPMAGFSGLQLII